MRMRADNSRHPPVEEVAERLLLAGRFGMEIDENDVGARLQAARRDLAIDGAKRTIELRHEHTTHGVDDEHIHAVARLHETRAPPGVPGGKLSGRMSRSCRAM